MFETNQILKLGKGREVKVLESRATRTQVEIVKGRDKGKVWILDNKDLEA